MSCAHCGRLCCNKRITTVFRREMDTCGERRMPCRDALRWERRAPDAWSRTVQRKIKEKFYPRFWNKSLALNGTNFFPLNGLPVVYQIFTLLSRNSPAIQERKKKIISPQKKERKGSENKQTNKKTI